MTEDLSAGAVQTPRTLALLDSRLRDRGSTTDLPTDLGQGPELTPLIVRVMASFLP